MNITERLQREAKRHPGATGEGVRIALKVLQECNCGTCEHGEEGVDHTNPATDGEEYFECVHPNGMSGSEQADYCSHWEARQ